MSIIYLVIAFVLNSVANIILKVKSQQGLDLANLNLWQIFTHNLLFIFGLFLFAINVLFYYLALRNIPLSTAYPVMVVMSFLIINSYAYFFLSEKINAWQLVGYFLVILGVIFVSYFSKSN